MIGFGWLSAISKAPTRRPVRGARSTLRSPARPSRVSVVVACHNYGRFLADCLESVLAQREVELEVIVVDDASSDETPRIVGAFAARDPRIKTIRHETNQGHIATFNEGLRAASGEYVLKLDADDLLAPGALARAGAVMEAHPEVGLVYGHPHYFEGVPPALPGESAKNCIVWPGRDWLAERCRTGVNCITNPEAVVRRSLLVEGGYYDPRLPHTFDFELWLRLAAVSDVARIDGAVQGLYRVHPASFQRTIHAGVLINLRGRRDAFDVVFDGLPAGALPEARELLARARDGLARQALDQACHAYDRGRIGEEPMEELVAFARETSPAATELPEWRALARRRRVGAHYARWMPPFVARAAVRRVGEELSRSRWLRYGL